jgi:hypothetical protein
VAARGPPAPPGRRVEPVVPVQPSNEVLGERTNRSSVVRED